TTNNFFFISYLAIHAPDLKSVVPKGTCPFDSGRGHHTKIVSLPGVRLGKISGGHEMFCLARFGMAAALCAAVSFACITPGIAAAAPAGTRLITLGTRSGPFPTVARAQTSNVLIVNGALYVIDAGDGVVRRLTRAKIAIPNIDSIFITHAHSDHT